MKQGNVLILGSGGREHAIAHSLSKSPLLKKLFCIPANPGIAELCQTDKISLSDFEALATFCEKEKIDLVVVGPEQPLAEGIVDFFTQKNILIFGPSQKAARIESSKAFAKNLMAKYKIPTASYKICNSKKQALQELSGFNEKLVVKASGLAAGKGVIICENHNEAKNVISEIFNTNKFGLAGKEIVLEEFMEGEEISVFAFTDGKSYVLLSSAQDHKRILEGDKGANTGGMGAYSPVPVATKEVLKEIKDKIIQPTISALANEGSVYKGVLYAGLMLTKNGIKVVEFNCRLGDPETQVVLPLVKSDLLELILACVQGNVKNYKLELSGKFASTVVLASKGYPEIYEKGKIINGLQNFKNSDELIIFHAGTKIVDGNLVTNGGRVFSITGVSENLQKSLDLVYKKIEEIGFDGKIFRKDIGYRALKGEKT
ncbi:phosphoribosylamine--glycine ligase [bacterium]|nr:phosphoribosylamine--glycine ligase [bacterium]